MRAGLKPKLIIAAHNIPSLNLRLTFTSCHLYPQARETVTHLVRCVVAVVNSLHHLISEFWWASDNSIHSRWRADNLVCSEQSLVSNSKSSGCLNQNQTKFQLNFRVLRIRCLVRILTVWMKSSDQPTEPRPQSTATLPGLILLT